MESEIREIKRSLAHILFQLRFGICLFLLANTIAPFVFGAPLYLGILASATGIVFIRFMLVYDRETDTADCDRET